MCLTCSLTQTFDPTRHYDVNGEALDGSTLQLDAADGEVGSVATVDNVYGTSWGETRSTVGDAGGVVTWSLAGAGYDIVSAFGASGTSVDSSVLGFDVQATISAAFDAWATYGNIEFMQVEDSGGDPGTSHMADIRVFFGSIPGSTIGLAYYPSSWEGSMMAGDMILDSDASNNWADNQLTFFGLVLHEIGHALGLGHDDSGVDSIMTSFLSENALQAYDISGIQTIYGAQDNAAAVYDMRWDQADVNILEAPNAPGLTINGNGLANRIDATNGHEEINGGTGDDFLIGRGGSDTLNGGAGHDRLNGGGGVDTMRGGDGDDIYWINRTGDVVEENAGEGNDILLSFVDFDLGTNGANVETLRLVGSGAADATGNGLDNRLIGNDLDNTLDGAGGVDVMRGGLGNDTYVVNHANDRGVEFSGQGIDTVIASVSFNLAATSQHIERLQLGGSADLEGYGNDADNRLTGNDGANLLVGRDGADTLIGSGGIDTLSGGNGDDTLLGGSGDDILFGLDGADTLNGGAGDDRLLGGTDADLDVFVFEDGFGIDRIVDFDPGEDIIDLSGVSEITDFTDLDLNHMSQMGAHTRITDGADVIILIDTIASTLTAGDFDFIA